MSAIPQATADKILAQCGRHCCVCRKFRPLLLQVHHIKEQGEGGTHEEDNLIATCVNCHAEVHTETRLTRRFTEKELKLHRDAVYELVANGKLVEVADHEDSIERLTKVLADFFAKTSAASGIGRPIPQVPRSTNLSAAAVEILLAVATSDYGYINVIPHDGGLAVLAHPKQFMPETPRTLAALKHAIDQLITGGIIEGGPELYSVSVYGYQLADGMIAAAAQKN